MANLFKKAIVMTDLHLGLKGNSELHNQDCVNFIDWMVKLGKEQGCDTCLFLGDYHNNRATMNIRTMNYAVQCLEMLSKNFQHTFFIPGNHDCFYKDKRSVHSTEWAKHIPNITIVNEFFKEGDVSIVPWLLKDEHKRIEKIAAQYCFGHFELPGYYMNSSVKMPEHGDIRPDHFRNIGTVFSGHFHKRQTGKNITYIGNCFPHNYGDAGDDARGCMILDWGSEPEYHVWPDQPRYRVYDLSHVLQCAEVILKPQMYVRVNIDIDISYEESTFIKENFADTYSLREIALLPIRQELADANNQSDNNNFLSVSQIVSEQLLQINSDHYDPKFLLDIYNTL